jgi:hypothetical protein
MPHPARRDSQAKGANRGKKLSDERLLVLVQRQTFRYFWEAAHPVSALAHDRCQRLADPADDSVAIGGSGFGLHV